MSNPTHPGLRLLEKPDAGLVPPARRSPAAPWPLRLARWWSARLGRFR